jgi:hypothetical protein
MFRPTASPTPSPAKDSVSAKELRSGRGMSAPCPACLSPSMSSPCPWTGNGQAMSAGSPQQVRVRVQSSSASSPCPRKCPRYIRKSLCAVRRLASATSKHVRTKSASLDAPNPRSSPRRGFVDEQWLATKSPRCGIGVSAHWPAGVRIKST